MKTRGIRVAAGVIVVFLLALMGPVLYQLIVGSVIDSSNGTTLSFTGKYYADLLHDHNNLGAAANTVLFALGSAAVAVLVGGYQAWVAERTNAPLRRLAYVSAVALIGIPYLVYVIAWVLVLGRSGLVNTALAWITGSDDPAIFNVNSLAGMILVEGFVWSPLSFLLIAASMKQVNPAFEEAARTCGAGIGTVIRRVTLPLAWPAVLAVALLAFVRATEAFEVPAIVGLPGDVNVITTSVYVAIQEDLPPNYGLASALSLLLMLIVGGLLWWYGGLSKKADRYQVITGSNYRPEALDLGRWRYLFSAGSVALFAVIVGIPMVVLVWVSLVPVYQGINGSLFHFTMNNYRSALDVPSLVNGAINTLVLCLVAGVLASFVASVAAWFVVRRVPAGRMIDQLMSLPLVMPGIVIGLSVSQVALGSPLPLYGSLWVLGLGYLISFLPFAMRYAYAGAIQIQPALEESALVSGSRYIPLFRRIVLPLLTPSLVTGGLFVFLQGMRALSMPILLASPHHPVAAVSLYDMWTNGSTTEVAAFGVVWTLAMVAVSVLLYVLARRSRVALF